MNERKWWKTESKWPTDFSQDFNKKVREVLLICSWQYSRKRTIGRTYNIHIWPFFYLQVENHWIQTLNLKFMTHVFYNCSTGEQPWVKMNFCNNPWSVVTWENLKVVSDKFSTLSLTVFVVVSVMQCIHTHIHT